MRSVAATSALVASVALALALAGAPTALAQTRTPWQQHDGLEVTEVNPLGLVGFFCEPSTHGDVCEYENEDIPAEDDPAWVPAPDGDTIDYNLYPSRLCSAPVDCFVDGDFTYFQTLVDVPADVTPIMKIDFKGIDDGMRVTVFNSEHPEGLALPDPIALDGSGTTDLSGVLVSGDLNRVVVTHVDDCCSESDLRQAVVTLTAAATEVSDADGE